jgi:hypothetical protein
MAVAVDTSSSRTHILFDLGSTLDIRWPTRLPAEPGELWSMHVRRRFVAVYTGGHFDTGSTRTAGEPRPMKRSGNLIIAADRRWRDRAALSFAPRAG